MSKKTIIKLCQKFDATGLVTDKKKKRACTFGAEEHRQFVEECISTNPALTARELADKIEAEFQITVSRNRINVL